MLELSIENRTFFSNCILQHSGGDRAVADKVPMPTFVKALLEIKTKLDAEAFFAGHIHWLQGKAKKTRSLELLLDVARSNVRYCFEEKMSKVQQALWSEVLAEPVQPTGKTPEEARIASQGVAEKLKAGKDPALLASLAKKAMLKTSGAQ